MEWKRENITKPELDKKQSDYMNKAMEMAKKAKQIAPEAEIKAKAAPVPAPEPEIKAKRKHAPKHKIIEKIAEKPVEHITEKIVERAVEKPVEKVVEKPVPVIIERERPTRTPTNIHIDNRSKKIEINADVDLNVNVPLFVKGKAEGEAAPVRGEEMREEVHEEFLGEDEVYAEREECDETTEHPFEGFECGCEKIHEPECEPCRGKTSVPPNFNGFINEHNRRSGRRAGNCFICSICGGRRRSSSGNCSICGGSHPTGTGRPGGFSWKDFKKN